MGGGIKSSNCDGRKESFHVNPEGEGETIILHPRVSTVDSSIYRVRCDQAPKGTKTSTVQASLGISVTAVQKPQDAEQQTCSIRNKDCKLKIKKLKIKKKGKSKWKKACGS